jgi:hypothetical protein
MVVRHVRHHSTEKEEDPEGGLRRSSVDDTGRYLSTTKEEYFVCTLIRMTKNHSKKERHFLVKMKRERAQMDIIVFFISCKQTKT